MEPLDEIAELQYGDHLGHLYDEFDDQIAVVAALFKGAQARGDKCIYFVEEAAVAAVSEALATALGTEPGQSKWLSVMTGFYRGEPDAQAVERRLDEMLAQTLAEGFSGLRLVVDMSWARGIDPVLLTAREGLADKWCAQGGPAIVVCQYHQAQLAPEILQASLRTHPQVILKGQLVPNPYCEPAELTTEAETIDRRVQWMIGRLGATVEDAGLRRARERRALFLAEASMLLGSTLDLNTIFKRIAELAIPILGDLCIVDIVDETGRPARVTVADKDPTRARVIEDHWRRYSAEPESYPLLARVLRSGRTEIFSDVDAEMPSEFARRPEYRDAARQMGWQSVMMVPMVAHGRVLGAISLHFIDSPRRYDQSDLAFAESLARAAALAVDNSRLHREAQQLAASRERLRMANELHDTLNQSLFSIGLKLDWSLHKLRRRSKVHARLEEIRKDAGAMMAQIRRLIAELSSEDEAANPLDQRIRELVEQFQELTGIAVQLELETEVDVLSPRRQDVLYKALREALTNVAKHAHASHVRIRIAREGGEIAFEVIDDGVGVPAGRAFPDFAAEGSHFGLRQMATRLEEEGGRLHAGPAQPPGFKLAGGLPIAEPTS